MRHRPTCRMPVCAPRGLPSRAATCVAPAVGVGKRHLAALGAVPQHAHTVAPMQFAPANFWAVSPSKCPTTTSQCRASARRCSPAYEQYEHRAAAIIAGQHHLIFTPPLRRATFGANFALRFSMAISLPMDSCWQARFCRTLGNRCLKSN